jgi:hypothetical protein
LDLSFAAHQYTKARFWTDPEVIAGNGCTRPHHLRFSDDDSTGLIRFPGRPFSPGSRVWTFVSFFLSFFLFPIFFAHRSGSSSPLRPTRLLLSRFHPHWVPPKADACLRLHAPRSLVPQRKRGREKGKNKMSYLYVKWNRFGLRFARRRFRHESMVCLALAPPVAKTCDAGGGALRS